MSQSHRISQNPPELALPAGNRYSHAVRVGNTVYVSGQVSLNLHGEVVGTGDPARQMSQVLGNLDAVLRSVGATRDDVVKTTTYVVGVPNLDAIRSGRSGHFRDPPPASTLVVVEQLARPEFLVEIDAIAVVE